MENRVLVAGAWFWNKGAEAMLRAVQAGILAQLPGVTGLLQGPPNTSVAPEILRGLQVWSFGARRGAKLGLLCRSGAATSPLLRRAVPAWRGELGLTAVVDISGYKCGDDWQRPLSWTRARFAGSLKQALRRALVGDSWTIYRALAVPVFHLPQAWGPFEHRESREVAARVLEGATKVYARDAVSYDWLRSLPSFAAEKVERASDIAFAFAGGAPEMGQALLSDLGARPGEQPIVGLVPNMRVYERAEGEGAGNAYVQRLVAIARWFIRERDCQVVLMPHEIGPVETIGRDDRYLCRLLAEVLDDPRHVSAAVAEYSAEQLKAMIGQTELLVSSRFHSLIAALSLRRPVVALGWSHKYQELLGGVGLAEYGVPHASSPAALLELCDRAWASREAMRQTLQERVPAHEASAAAVLREVTEMISHAG